MKLLFLFVLAVLIHPLVNGQATSITDLSALRDQFAFEKSKENTLNGATYDNVKGSPYLNDEFVLGIVWLNDSVRIEKVPLRYNIYNDKIEFKNEEKVVLEIPNSKERWIFRIGNSTFLNRLYVNEVNEQRGVLELLVDGKIKLYRKNYIEFKPATKAIGYQDAQPDRFVRLDDRYAVSIDNKLPVVYPSIKELLEVLRQIKPDVNDYAKSQKLKVKSPQGLAKLVEYCNQ